jgi:HEAT repeat protein
MNQPTMSSTTHHPQPEPGTAEAVDVVIGHAEHGAVTPALVAPLSDLSREGVQRLRQRWSEIAATCRAELVQAMAADAEASVERNYDRALLIALDDESGATRLAAVEALWELESPAFLDALLQRIEDEPDERVRAAEAMALGRFALLGELEELSASSAARTRDVLLRLHGEDTSLEVRRRALEALGCFAGDDDVVDEIQAAYDAGTHALRVSALHAMGRQADSRWVELVHEELTSDEPELRFEAVTAAGMIGDERSIPLIIDLVDDEDTEVRLAAVGALGNIGGTLAVNVLRRLCRSDSPAIAEAAQDALEEAMLYANPLRPLL